MAVAPRAERPSARTTRLDATRRRPVDWRQYSAHVEIARGKVPRFEHPVGVTLAASILFAGAAVWVLQTMATGLGAGISSIGSDVLRSIPSAEERDLSLAEQNVQVGAEPVVSGLPAFTKSTSLLVQGKVPAFALKSERRVLLTLNGKIVGAFPMDPSGSFATPLTLADGSNTIVTALVEGTTVIASSSHTVVVDRVAPPIALVRPKNGETVDGPNVVVEGKTDAGAVVTVNDRPLQPNPDGAFSDTFAVKAGPLQITIASKDQAGNETITRLAITVKEPTSAPVAGLQLSLGLDRTKVRPSETVIADISALEGGKAKPDVTLTFQVGVITIGTYKTDSRGRARVPFAAPDHEVDDVAVVVLGGGTSARANLTVSKGTP